MSGVTISHDGITLVIRIPMRLARHGARKRIIAPDDAPDWAPPAPRIDSTIVKAIARAFRWRRMLETGVHDTVDDIATSEKITPLGVKDARLDPSKGPVCA